MSQNVLVTGGAGYIGGHVVRAIGTFGRIVVLDDLSTGRSSTVPEGVELIEGSILDRELLDGVFSKREIDCVIHLAGKKAPGESVREPELYFDTNVLGTQHVLRAMSKANVTNFLFSSSCSVYGTPLVDVVDELTQVKPESPYGQSKLIGEWMVDAHARAHELRTGTRFRWIALRYFNVIGAASALLRDTGSQNLIPLAFQALRTGVPLYVHGHDWNTPDRTCIRDYVDVEDLARAHALAAGVLLKGEWDGGVVNVSTGEGSSVLEALNAVSDAAGRPVPYEFGPRREGDPVSVVGSPATAQRVLGWSSEVPFRESIRRAVVAAQL